MIDELDYYYQLVEAEHLPNDDEEDCDHNYIPLM